MQFILDTNALIWWLEDPLSLSQEAHSAIGSPTNTVYCSAVSAVEIAIKFSTGKLTLEADWEDAARDAQFVFLPFTCDHAKPMQNLPLLHKDPFDRMLVAQCLAEQTTLITRDRILEKYGIPILVA